MQKLYYSISEVSKLVGEGHHILRYWEKEFDQLKPRKNRGGNRIYSEKDLVIIKIIKKLIRLNKLSLKGAKENLTKILNESTENFNEVFSEKEIRAIISDTSLKDNKNYLNHSDAVLVLFKNELRGVSELLKQMKEFLLSS